MMYHRPNSIHCAKLTISFVAALLAGASQFVASRVHAAETCVVPTDCSLGFCVDGFCCNTACTGDCEACSGAAKGGGVDGECGLAASGTVCKAGYCDGDSFSFIDASKCDADGVCKQPESIACLGNNPCMFDLCSDAGCEHITKLDGTECGGGNTCLNGVCGIGSASSSSSGSGGASGGAGGGGSGGSSGLGGAENGGSGGQTDPYPPARDTGSCECTTAGSRFSGTTAAFVMSIGIVLRQLRRAGRRSS